MKIPGLIICLLLVYFCAGAQDYTIDLTSFGIEKGLSHRDVQCVHQSSGGYIWVGTRFGLNKFDGYSFKILTEQNAGLSSNIINAILEDKQGNLWLFDTDYFASQNVKSLDVLNPVTNMVIQGDAFLAPVDLDPDDIIAFNSSSDGEIVFMTAQNKVFLYDSVFTSFTIDIQPYSEVLEVYVQAAEVIWVMALGPIGNGNKSAVFLEAFTRGGEKVHSIWLPGSYDYAKIYDSNPGGQLSLVASKYREASGFYHINPGRSMIRDTVLASSMSALGLNFNIFTEIDQFEKRGPFYWVSLDNVSTLISTDPDNSFQIPIPVTYTTGFDISKENLGWISSQFGVHKVKIRENHFVKYAQSLDSGLQPIRGMAIDESAQLWFVQASVRDLFRVPLKMDKNSKDEVVSFNAGLPLSDRMPFKDIYMALFKCSNGDMIYSTPTTAFRFDPETRGFQSIEFMSPEDEKGIIWTFYEDEEGDIWFGTDKGWIGYFNDGPASVLPQLEETNNLLHVYHFYRDFNGVVWIATQNGLFTLDTRENRILERYWMRGEGLNRLPVEEVYHLVQEEDGSFWLATGGNGLVHWWPDSGEFKYYGTNEGLSNNIIYAVYEDDYGNLWLPSDRGLNCFNKSSERVYTYLESDGITHNEFNRISHCRDKDGTMYFGGLNGITAFHPKDFIADTNLFNAPVVLTHIEKLTGENTEMQDAIGEYFTRGELVLDKQGQFALVEFALLNYENPANLVYATMIEGIDPGWHIHKENYIRLAKLPYGSHSLKVKAQNERGQWSTSILEIPLYVPKPIYLTLPFILGLIALFVVLTIAFFNLRMRRLEAQKLRLEEIIRSRTHIIEQKNEMLRTQTHKLQTMNKLKSQFFVNIAHELRTPLSLIMGPLGSVLKSNRLEERNQLLLQNARQNSRNLLSLVDQILDLSKLEAGQLSYNEAPIKIYSLARSCFEQFKSSAVLQKVRLVFNYRGSEGLVVLGDEQKLRIVIINLLSNALKFTPDGGTVDFEVSEKHSHLEIKVTDTGKGIHEDDLPHVFDRFYQTVQRNETVQGGTGVGLSIVKEYVDLFGGQVRAESNSGSGSTFIVTLPKKEVAVQQEPLDIQEQAELVTGQNAGSIDRDMKMEVAHMPASQPRILIVEDNPDVRNYIDVILSSEYSVVHAKNGDEGMRKLKDKKNAPDLIITDLMMPVMDGFEFLGRVRADQETANLPVVVLTAMAGVHDKRRAIRIGVDDYLVKPFDEDELLASVRRLLKNYHNRRGFNAQNLRDGEGTIMTEENQQWLMLVESLALKGMQSQLLSVSWLASECHLSERQLHRKIKGLTGLTPQKYIADIRLHKARTLLFGGKMTSIAQVSAAVGFTNANSFTRSYKRHFGQAPTAHMKSEFRKLHP